MVNPSPQDLPMSYFNGIYSIIKCLFCKSKNDLFFGFRFKVLYTKTFKNTLFFTCFLVYVFKNCKQPPVFSVFVRFRHCQKKGKRDTNFFSTYSLTIPKNLEFSTPAKVKMPTSKNLEKTKKTKKLKTTIFQDSCKSKNAKIQKTSRKTKKTIFQDSCLLTLSPDFWNIVFFCFLFFWFSRGFLDFCIFTFARVLEYCFFSFFVFFGFSRFLWILAFLLLQESWNIVFFSFFVFLVFSRCQKTKILSISPQIFGILEFWKTRGFLEIWRSQKKTDFWKFAKLKKHLSCAKIQKSQDYAYILEYFLEFSKNSVVCNLSVSFVSIICFHVLIHSVHVLNCSS